MKAREVTSVFLILLGFAILLGVTMGMLFPTPYGNIMIIKIDSKIQSGSGGLLDAATSSESIINKLEEASLNPLIEAVILDINSGGGTSVASYEIVKAVKDFNKPIVSLIREVGASGAYWVASASDYIVANDFSFVGSIGVTMEYLEYSGLLERFNVTYVNLSYPEHKSIFSEYRELTPTERARAEAWLKTLYERLVSDIALNRNMTVEELTPYANGSIFTGYEAIEYGLIDELGGFNEALNKTITLANITEPLIIKSKETINLLDLISGINNKKEIALSI